MLAGNIRKMVTNLTDSVEYSLPVGEELLGMNQYIGKQLHFRHTGNIHCVNCGKKTKKSYSQGHCYTCMMTLASCDMCIMKPETCHYAQGTCREPSWGEANCLRPHYLYLANSSGVKVGITRETQIPTRWIDQGAIQALPIAKVQSRLQVGLMEVILKDHVNDKTNWRKMLKNEVEPLDLQATRDTLFETCQSQIAELQANSAEGDIELIDDAKVVDINYPVLSYPTKISSFNFDKAADVSGILNGIKGQYLLFDNGVINMRKFTGYELQLIE